MDVVKQILDAMAIIVPLLIGTGLLNKYLPFMRNVSNNLTPWLNAAIAFFALFGTPVAHAGILGTVGDALNLPAKIVASFLLSYWTSKFYDKFLSPLLPPGPMPTPKV